MFFLLSKPSQKSKCQGLDFRSELPVSRFEFMVLRIVLICHTQWHVLMLRVVAQNVIDSASTDSHSPHVLSIYAAVSHCSWLSGLKASGLRARQHNQHLTMKAEMVTAKWPKAMCCPLGRFCFLSCHFLYTLPTLF